MTHTPGSVSEVSKPLPQPNTVKGQMSQQTFLQRHANSQEAQEMMLSVSVYGGTDDTRRQGSRFSRVSNQQYQVLARVWRNYTHTCQQIHSYITGLENEAASLENRLLFKMLNTLLTHATAQMLGLLPNQHVKTSPSTSTEHACL